MDPYVHDVLERNAREMRDRAAPHHRSRLEIVAERAAARRLRRFASVRAGLAALRGHASDAPVPASAGGRT